MTSSRNAAILLRMKYVTRWGILCGYWRSLFCMWWTKRYNCITILVFFCGCYNRVFWKAKRVFALSFLPDTFSHARIKRWSDRPTTLACCHPLLQYCFAMVWLWHYCNIGIGIGFGFTFAFGFGFGIGISFGFTFGFGFGFRKGRTLNCPLTVNSRSRSRRRVCVRICGLPRSQFIEPPLSEDSPSQPQSRSRSQHLLSFVHSSSPIN